MSVDWDSDTNHNTKDSSTPKSGHYYAENFLHLIDNKKLNWNRKSVCVLKLVKSGSGRSNSSRQRSSSLSQFCFWLH